MRRKNGTARIDSIATAHRNLTAEVASTDASGISGVKAWSQKRGADVTRIRSAVDNIVLSGLNLSKVTVASSLLGDLARGTRRLWATASPGVSCWSPMRQGVLES